MDFDRAWIILRAFSPPTISVISASICFLPCFKRSDNFSIEIYNEIYYHEALFFAFGVCTFALMPILPYLFDAIFNKVFSKTSESGVLYRSKLYFIIIFFNALIHEYVIPTNSDFLFPAIYIARELLFIQIIIQRLGNKIYCVIDPKIATIVNVLISISAILNSFLPIVEHGNLANGMASVALALQVLSSVILFLVFIFWLINFRMIENTTNLLPSQMNCCVIVISSILYLFMGWILKYIYIIRVNFVCQSLPTDYLVAYTYLEIVFVVGVTLPTAAFAHKEVVLTKDELEAKRAFVRYISHELRTPMNIALNGCKYLKEATNNEMGPDKMETINDILESCSIVVRTLDSILFIDKLETASVELTRVDVPVVQFINEILRPFYRQARRAGIALRLIISPELRSRRLKGSLINIDRQKMGQVMQDILSNAFKFTAQGGEVAVHLAIHRPPASRHDSGASRSPPVFGSSGAAQESISNSRVPPQDLSPTDNSFDSACNNAGPVQTPSDSLAPAFTLANTPPNQHTHRRRSMIGLVVDNAHRRVSLSLGSAAIEPAWCTGEYVKISVTDSGVGLSQVDQSKLFRQAVQFDTINVDNGHGTGLALLIAKGIVDLHDGKIGVYSKGEGHGCTFFVELSLKSGATQAVMEQIEAEEAASSDSSEDVGEQRRNGLVHSSHDGSRACPGAGFVDVSHSRKEMLLRNEFVDDADDRGDSSYPCSAVGSEAMEVVMEELEEGKGDGRQGQSGAKPLPNQIKDQSVQRTAGRPNAQGSQEFERRLESRESLGDRDSAQGKLSISAPTDSALILQSSRTSLARAIDNVTSIFRPQEDRVSSGDVALLLSQSEDKKWASSKPRLLVVDDSPSNLKMMCRMLASRAGSIEQAEDGAIALAIIKKSIHNGGQSFDAVLMDNMMPNMDGPTAAKAMRDIGYAGLIVGITGNGLEADIQTYRSKGANAVLLKPLNLDSLDAIMKDCVAETVKRPQWLLSGRF